MARRPTGAITEHAGTDGLVYRSLRFSAYGKRHRVPLGAVSQQHAERELRGVLADVERGVWQPALDLAPQLDADPTFHEFASDWYEAKRVEIRSNTARSYKNDLTRHLLPFYRDHRLSQITVSEVDRYRNAKVREGRLSARSINMTLALLAQVMEAAVEYGHVPRNPASGRRRRLKAPRPRPVHLDTAEHLAVMLDAAGDLDREGRVVEVGDRRGRAYERRETAQTTGRRAAVAVLLLAGLRAEEVATLRWRDVDLANGRIYVGRSKTAAGMREVDLLPLLREELTEHKTTRPATDPDDPVFVTAGGKPRDRHNLRQRVVAPVVRRADEILAERGEQPLPAGISPHKLRHTFASLLVALGRDPAYVMGQLGHTDPAFTLRVYAHVMRRDEGERERLRALVEGEVVKAPANHAQSANNGQRGATDAVEAAAPGGS